MVVRQMIFVLTAVSFPQMTYCDRSNPETVVPSIEYQPAIVTSIDVRRYP